MRRILILVLLVALKSPADEPATTADEPFTVPPLKDGDVILFLGDSLAQHGNWTGGYIDIMSQAIWKRFPTKDIKLIGAGVGNNTIQDVRDRFDRDVIWKQPTIVMLDIGMNDILSRSFVNSPVQRARFELGYKDLIWRIRRIGARPVLATHTLFGEKKPGTNPHDALLEEYSALIRKIGREKRCQVIELRKPLCDYVARHNPDNLRQGVLTTDGAHPNERGNRLLADIMLRALGVITNDMPAVVEEKTP